MHRRDILRLAGAVAALGAFGPAASAASGGRVVVVGGGFAGATCAKYIRTWSPGTEVTLVEASRDFISCPMSNRVIAGMLGMRDLTRNYRALESRHGIRLVHDTVTAIDTDAREVRLASGASLAYDRLVIAPGVDFAYETMPGLESAGAQRLMPHAWKAGPQTLDLRQRLTTLREGGVFAMHIPKVPFRCPPGPYERACLVASAMKRFNPRGKVLVFDSNPDILAKRDLFFHSFVSEYKGIIEYIPNAGFESANAAQGRVTFDVHGEVDADIWNVIPPQRAGNVARTGGLANVDNRWCEVDFLTYESRVVPNVHIIGDSIASAPGTPKSGHMANQQAKVCAAAIAALLAGRAPSDEPIIANTCYSFVNDKEAMHVAGVYKFDAEKRTMVSVPGSGGLSPSSSSEEGFMAVAWIFNILNDTLS